MTSSSWTCFSFEGPAQIEANAILRIIAALGETLATIAVDEERVRQLLKRRDSDQLQRRILQRHADVEGVVTEITKGVGQSMFDNRHHRGVINVRFMQPQNRERSHKANILLSSLPTFKCRPVPQGSVQTPPAPRRFPAVGARRT